MKRFAVGAVGLVALLTLLATTASAQLGGSDYGLVPSFDGDKKLGPPPSSSAKGSTLNRVLDSIHPRHAVSATKSTFRKLNGGTRRMMAQTKTMLTPWKRDSSKRTPGFLAKNKSSGKKKTSLFSSWLRRKEEPSRPPTLSEWIGRPKP